MGVAGPHEGMRLPGQGTVCEVQEYSSHPPAVGRRAVGNSGGWGEEREIKLRS